MKPLLFATLFCILPGSCLAQLKPEQKLADFQNLVGLYDKFYAPYEWKEQLFGFDALDSTAWLTRVSQTTNDLDFYELCVEYVASLNDTHDAYTLPSDFVARLGFTTDLYDGKLLVDSINRTTLPLSKYPIQIGDEFVSLDGKPVEQLLTDFAKYGRQGNPRSTRRLTAARITIRPQSFMPHAVDVGDSATVVIRSQNGNLQTYDIPWSKTGTPLATGVVPNPAGSVAGRRQADAPIVDDPIPDYMQALVDVQYSGVANDSGLNGYGSRTPIFALPDGFVQRLGLRSTDFFYSGTYTAGGFKIGYIRIPNYGSLATSVQQQFDDEIAYFQKNTDGLVVDEMRNTGGFLCFGENIMTRLATAPFRPIGYGLRAYYSRVAGFYAALESAKRVGAPQWVVDTYQAFYDELNSAYQENRGLTGPLPICGPSFTLNPASVTYSKPVMMLIDEFSTSTADSVPAMFQDAGRGPLFGWRTNGAGGTNTTLDAGAYSQGSTGMTLGLQLRPKSIATAEYPVTDRIENVGVRPDIQVDYMTTENLLQQGKPFVTAFTAAIVDLIGKGR